MNKFEDIIGYEYINNKQGFESLIDYLKLNRNATYEKNERDGIITYIGTGLSFYCKQWGFPFLAIMMDYKNYFSNSQKKELEKLYKKKQYMELGDELDKVIKSVSRTTDFNKEFIRVLKEMGNDSFNFDEKKVAFLIPFLSYKHITTNCDDSIQRAYKIVKDFTPGLLCNSSEDLTREKFITEDTPTVIHIHGSWDDYESLIMTHKKYCKEYKTEGEINYNAPIVKFLKKSAAKKHLIFLGSSLSKDDLAILVMKNELKINERIYGQVTASKSHIAFLKKTDHQEQLMLSNNLEEYGVQVFFTKEYEDQSTVLREAIREVKNPYWNKQNIFYKCCNNCDDKCSTCSKPIEIINEIMKSKAIYRIAEIDYKQQINLGPTLKKYLYDDVDRRTYKWRLCIINDIKPFDFDYNSPNPNPKRYNLPLGNTIFIIGGNKMTNDDVEECIKKIKKWVYSDDRKRKFNGNIRIRIIKIKSADSDYERKLNYGKNKYDNNIKYFNSSANKFDLNSKEDTQSKNDMYELRCLIIDYLLKDDNLISLINGNDGYNLDNIIVNQNNSFIEELADEIKKKLSRGK